jgi:hypothetical protein
MEKAIDCNRPERDLTRNHQLGRTQNRNSPKKRGQTTWQTSPNSCIDESGVIVFLRHLSHFFLRPSERALQKNHLIASHRKHTNIPMWILFNLLINSNSIALDSSKNESSCTDREEMKTMPILLCNVGTGLLELLLIDLSDEMPSRSPCGMNWLNPSELGETTGNQGGDFNRQGRKGLYIRGWYFWDGRKLSTSAQCLSPKGKPR